MFIVPFVHLIYSLCVQGIEVSSPFGHERKHTGIGPYKEIPPAISGKNKFGFGKNGRKAG
ncbi:hypothetical protein CLI85_08905 [Tannerella forsythia]|nr:hypothetical protein CLI85_08905 [Tannerella forsythia]